MRARPRWLRPLLAVLLAMLAGALWQAYHWVNDGPGLETEITQLVPEGGMDPVEQRLYDELLSRGAGRLVVVVEGERAGAVEAAGIDLQDRLAALPGVARVDARPDPQRLDGLAAFLQPYREALLTPADRAALAENPEATVEAWMAEDPFFRPLPVSRDPLGTLGRFLTRALPQPGRIDSDGFFYWLAREPGEPHAIATFAELSPEGIGAGRNDRLRSELRALFKDVRETHGIGLNASSVLFHGSAAKEQARWESTVFGAASAILIIGLLAWSFRSIQPVLVLLTVIGAALLTGLAAAGRLFTELHVLTLVMALPVIGITVDYVIHGHVHGGGDVGGDAGEGAACGLPPHLLRALCWSCLSSALGYAALGGVDIAVMRQVSVVLVAGLVTALLWVVAFACVFPSRANRRRIEQLAATRLVQRAERGVSVARPVLAGALGAAIAAALAAAWLGGVRIVDEPGALYHVEPELVRADRAVQERLGLPGNRRALVVEGASVEQVLQRQEALVAGLESALDVRAAGLGTLVPPAARQQENRALSRRAYAALNDADAARLRGQGASMPRAGGELLRPAALPGAVRDRLPPFHLEPGGDQPAWAALSLAVAADWPRVASWCGEQAGCRVVDSVDDLTAVLADTHRVARGALYAAVLLVGGVLVLRYRRRGAWGAGALLVVMLGGHLVPGLFGLPLTLFGTGGLFVLLGLSVDYIVFTAEAARRRDLIWLAFGLSAATTSLTFGFLLFSLTPAVTMLAAPVAAGLPLMLLVLYFIQPCLAPAPASNNYTAVETNQ